MDSTVVDPGTSDLEALDLDLGLSGGALRKHKKLVIALVPALFLAAALIAIITATKSHTTRTISSETHLLLKTSCGPTLYPDLCYSEMAAAPGTKLSTQKDVIQKSLSITTTAVEHNYFTVKKLITNKSSSKNKLTERETVALHDCLETIDETLDDLRQAAADLREYPNKKSLSQHADDLKTLMSAAMTNQETCLDGFSHDRADKRVRRTLQDGQVYVERMCSNALAMIKNMTDTDIQNDSKTQKRQLREKEDNDWPHWLSGKSRRMLLEEDPAADAVVVADGSGNYTTVGEAVEGAPEKSKKRYVIKIKAGVYKENVEVPKKKHNIMFVGDGRNNTIITASRNVVDGATTFHSATVAVVGEGFLARDITFENTAGPAKHQAVALRVGSDLSAFYRCDILAYQDTLYAHSNRQFYAGCFIAGTVDFIFGNGAAVFQDCDIHARRPGSGQKNMVTAQGRKDPNQNTGIVIHRSRIGATSDLLEAAEGEFPTYLGRPWKEYSRTVVMRSNISDVIHPAGWHEWNATFAFDTLYYGEYENGGSGANTSSRVRWSGLKIMSNDTEASQFTVKNFIGGDNWLNSTGFPFSLGL